VTDAEELVAQGYEALRTGDSTGARRAFEAVAPEPPNGAVVEGLARAAYLDHAYLPAIEPWVAAYEAYRGGGDGVGAIRVARTLAYMYLSILGDAAVMRGWFARAVSLLADEGPCAESGWVSLNQGMFESDPKLKELRYREALALSPGFAERVGAATRVDRFHGSPVPNFFRKPYGPGWALVGDAGYTKDPITAQGISNAFLDAERCATALDAVFASERPFDEAMAGWHAERDAHAMAIYEFTTQMATLEPPPPEMQQLLGAISSNQPAMDAFVSVTAGTLSPAEFFNPAYIEGLMSAPV